MIAADPWQVWAGLTAGGLLLAIFGPARAPLRDGLRAVERYPAIWLLPGAFGCCYALFQLGVRAAVRLLLPVAERPPFAWGRPWALPADQAWDAFADGVLPAAEGVAGIFNNVVTTYPVSAVAALLLLVNWGGHHRVLNRALRHRFGGWGWGFNLAIAVCALAAVGKPPLYCLLPVWGQQPMAAATLFWLMVTDWLSFLFEYLFGVCVQLYLILHVFVWVRGLNFTASHLLDFAIRRFSVVAKWAGVVLAASTLLIHLPLIFAHFPAWRSETGVRLVLTYLDYGARPLLAVALVACCGLQIILTFHAESVGRALRDHTAFISRNWWTTSWLLGVAWLLSYALQVLNAWVLAGVGEGSGAGVLWQIGFPWLAGGVAGWLLAAWVCLYKRCEHGRRGVDWIPF